MKQGYFAIAIAAAIGSWSIQAYAGEPEYKRLIRLWNEFDPPPKWDLPPPGYSARKSAAVDQACGAAKARSDSASRQGMTPEYKAAYAAYSKCTNEAAGKFRWENDPGFRVYDAWAKRNEERHDKASRGLLSPPPNVPRSNAPTLNRSASPDAVARSGSINAASAAPPATSQSASAATVAAARNKAAANAAAATAVPPLRPTAKLEAHNPAADATNCLEPIFHTEFKARGVKSNMEAVIRNTCARKVTVTWCIKGWDCKPGYSNLGTVPARGDMPVSFVYKGPTRMRLAGCYNGFTSGQGELSKKLLHSCK